MIERGLRRRGPRPAPRGPARRARPPARRSATPSCSPSWTTTGASSAISTRPSSATIRGDPALRPPPAVVVPPRPAHPLARRRGARTRSTAPWRTAAYAGRHEVAQGARDGERLRRRCPTSTVTIDLTAAHGPGPVRPPGRASVPTASCASCAAENDPDAQGNRGRRALLHGLPQRRRLRRRDVRKRNSCVSCDTSSGSASLSRMRRWRHAAGSCACGLAGTETSAWTWVCPGSLPTGRSSPPPLLVARPALGAVADARTRTSSCRVARRRDLAALDLSPPPTVEPPLPHGQNVEFVVRAGARHLRMRVHERGSGETRSCGTGICAAVVAVAAADGPGPDGVALAGRRPGRHLRGRAGTPDGRSTLTGPAVIVAELEIDDDWWRALSRGPVRSWCTRVSRWTVTMTQTAPTARRPRRRRHRRLRARGTPGPAPRRRPVDRTPGRHRGRVPPAAPRASRPRRRLDERQRRRGRELAGRARPPRRDRGLARPGRPDPAPRQARPRDLHRLGQGQASCATSCTPTAPTR